MAIHIPRRQAPRGEVRGSWRLPLSGASHSRRALAAMALNLSTNECYTLMFFACCVFPLLL